MKRRKNKKQAGANTIDSQGNPLAGNGEQSQEKSGGLILFKYGFRPFFLLAGFYAVAAVLFWLVFYSGRITFASSLPPSLWHGHEMLYGFGMAAVSGFLLTAVPSWTGSTPVKGRMLAFLVGLWLAGRIAFWSSGSLPLLLVSLIDLAYIPVLGGVAVAQIVSVGQKRNYIFPALLALHFVANLLIHLEFLGFGLQTARTGLHMGIYLFALMIAVIGGRVVPSFTANSLFRRGIEAEVKTHPLIDKLALLFLLIAAIADLAGVGGPINGGLSLLAAVLLLLRMRQWHSSKILGEPIVWVLHAGYLWLPVGFAVKGLSALSGFPPEGIAFHAFTVGGIGTMTLAMMSRAALGHTGRDLVVSKWITAAYLAVTLAAVVRVFGPMAVNFPYNQIVMTAGGLWTAGFAFFTIVYWPILTGPRTDGMDG